MRSTALLNQFPTIRLNGPRLPTKEVCEEVMWRVRHVEELD